MNLSDKYNKLYEDSIAIINADEYVLDPLLDSLTDRRFGITLIMRPNLQVLNQIKYFLNELNELEPSQYYYPINDIHLTVMSIISCYEGFSLSSLNIE